jgi:hypothetical protein
MHFLEDGEDASEEFLESEVFQRGFSGKLTGGVEGAEKSVEGGGWGGVCCVETDP